MAMAMACFNECTASPLLCLEDQDSLLVFGEENGADGEAYADQYHIGSRDKVAYRNGGFFEDVYMDLPLQSDECLVMLVSIEADYLPRGGYAGKLQSGATELSVRSGAMDWIWKVHAHYKFGPLSAYLAVNYLDRFLSCWECPNGMTWMTQLLSVACLSLAAKMEEAEVPLSLDLQQVGEAKYLFESRTIQRMELLILTTLKWRMRSVTPFSFIDYFLHKFNSGVSPGKELFFRAVDLILNTIRRVDLLRFRPSEIAAAVALSVVVGEKKNQQSGVEEALTSCIHIDQLRTLRCYQAMEGKMVGTYVSRPLRIDSRSMMVSSSRAPQSPAGILDASLLSDGSDDTATTVISDGSSPHSKRRKMERISTT